MKFKIDKKVLVGCLSTVIGGVSKNSTSKILENILLSVGDGFLTALSSNLEIQITNKCKCESEESGQTTVAGRKLFDIAKASKEGVLTFEIKDDFLVVKSGRSRFKLAMLPANDFPVIADIESTASFSMSGVDLKGILDKVSFSIADKDVRYYLNGMYFNIADGNIEAVSTDGHRMSILNHNNSTVSGEGNFIAPKNGLNELSKSLGSVSDVLEVKLTDNHIQVVNGGYGLISKLIDGKYPDYKAAIPKEILFNVSINKEEFIGSLSRCSLLADDKARHVKINLSDGLIEIESANKNQEKAKEALDIDHKGELQVGFNVGYLIDAVSHCDGKDVNLAFSGEGTSLIVKGSGNAEYIVMPVRI